MARGLAAIAAGLVLSLAVAGCTTDQPTPPQGSPPSSQPPAGPRKLTFGAFGQPG